MWMPHDRDDQRFRYSDGSYGGTGMRGWDAYANRYSGVWIDSDTHLVREDIGNYDATTQPYALSTEQGCPASTGHAPHLCHFSSAGKTICFSLTYGNLLIRRRTAIWRKSDWGIRHV
jgi:hypothetical protein